MNKILLAFFLVPLLLLESKEAYAYIDPGTGSLYLQILIGCLIGLIFAAKTFLKKIFGRFFKKDQNPDDR